MKASLLTTTLLALLVCLLITTTSSAQVAGGTITGNVTDAAGSLILNANVTITNKDTGVVRATVTNAEGFYTVPNLIPGNYQVKVSATGFGPKETTLTLTVGDEVNLPFSFNIGTVIRKSRSSTLFHLSNSPVPLLEPL